MTDHRPIYLHPEAIAEASAAARWYRERSLSVAKAFIVELERIIGKIAQTPEIYSHYVGHTLRALLRGFPFSIIFREISERIEVIALAHGRRRPGYWKNRLN